MIKSKPRTRSYLNQEAPRIDEENGRFPAGSRIVPRARQTV
jgi:hypothetical protein